MLNQIDIFRNNFEENRNKSMVKEKARKEEKKESRTKKKKIVKKMLAQLSYRYFLYFCSADKCQLLTWIMSRTTQLFFNVPLHLFMLSFNFNKTIYV